MLLCTHVIYPFIANNDHGYDVNHKNGSMDLTDKGIGVRKSFL